MLPMSDTAACTFSPKPQTDENRMAQKVTRWSGEFATTTSVHVFRCRDCPKGYQHAENWLKDSKGPRAQWTAWRSVILSGSVRARARKRLTQCVLVQLHDAYGFADIPALIPFRIAPSDLDIARVRRRPTRLTNRL